MKKIYFSILALLLITSFSDLKSGVLRQYDYTKYNYLFPDSLHKRFRIKSLDTNFTYLYIKKSSESVKDSTGKYKFISYAIHKYIFPGKPASNTIDVYDGDSLINVNFDSLEIKKYKNGWYNIKNSFINFSKNLHIKVPMTFIDTLDTTPTNNLPVDSIFNIIVLNIHITSKDEFFCIGGNGVYPNVGKSGIYKLVEGKWKLITKPWERISHIKKEFLLIYNYFFAANDDLFYTWNGAINKLNLNTLIDEEIAVFDSLTNTKDNFYKKFQYKDNRLINMVFNPIKNELILTYYGYSLILIYNILQKSYKYVQQDFDDLHYYLDRGHRDIFIDSNGTEYYITTSSKDNNKFRLMLIRDIDNKITPLELPQELILGHENQLYMDCFMSNDNKIYFPSKDVYDKDTVKPFYVYVYDHYSSGIEDDYHNKSLVFESPFPNPVGIESKVSGKFFAMPYLISGLTMDLYNINGSKVLDLSGSVNYDPSTGHGNYSFSTHGLPSGMYYLIFNSSVYKDCKNIIIK